MLHELGVEESEEPSAWDGHVGVEHVDVRYEGPELPTPRRAAAALPASERDRPHPDPVAFRLGAGYGTLGRVDVARCLALGLPAGYMRMRVTFRPNGHVVHAAVQSEVAPSHEALACIGNQLTAAIVPPFDGDDVTLSRVVFVSAGGVENRDEVPEIYVQSTLPR
jgi:hypothetical protein